MQSTQNHWTEGAQTKSDPVIKSDLLDVTPACEGGQQLWAHKNQSGKRQT